MKPRHALIILAALMLLGLLVGCLQPPSLGNIGNDTTTTNETPETVDESGHRAPVFNFNVQITGGDASRTDVSVPQGGEWLERLALDSNGEGGADGAPAPADSSQRATAVAALPDAGESAPLPTNDEPPVTKGGDVRLIGPVWGGATADEFNVMTCESVPLRERIEPIDPVWRGCRVYWFTHPSLNAKE